MKLDDQRRWPQNLTISKCSRLTRPLIARVHALTDLYAKLPSLFEFDVKKCLSMSLRTLQKFINPKTSQQRLSDLKSFLLPDVYDAYCDMFVNFKNIACVIFDLNYNLKDKKGKPGQTVRDALFLPNSRLARLSTLAATHLGKHITLGTKTTFLPLSQAMAFDKKTFPSHLLKYSEDLEDNIEKWLEMEPDLIFGNYRSILLMGFVINLLVINLTALLYPLIPVLVHWLKEKNLPFLSYLFMSFWNFLSSDPALRDVKDLLLLENSLTVEIFWAFHANGYWRQLVKDLLITTNDRAFSQKYSHFDALTLDALALTDKLNWNELETKTVYTLMRSNPQYCRNPDIMMLIVVQIIESNNKQLDTAATSQEAYAAILQMQGKVCEFLESWLAFNDNCIFHHQDRVNARIFKSLLSLFGYNEALLLRIFDYLDNHSLKKTTKEVLQRFCALNIKNSSLMFLLQLLESFYMEKPYQSQLGAESSKNVAELFGNLFEFGAQEDQIEELVGWLHEQDDQYLVSLAENIFYRFNYDERVSKRMRLDLT